MIITKANQSTLRPEGNLVAAALPQLRASMRDLVDSGVRVLVIDLSEVEMVDSAGLGLLISAHNSLQKSGGKLSVVEASPDVLELLTTMRMHQHFSICGRSEGGQ